MNSRGTPNGVLLPFFDGNYLARLQHPGRLSICTSRLQRLSYRFLNVTLILIKGEITMANTFLEMVRGYQTGFLQMSIIQKTYPAKTFAGSVLLKKLEKYDKAGNIRSIAKYIHLFYKENLGELPERAKTIARKHKLKRTASNKVGYPHADGTYHWFGY
jgi:hypothetical protein